MLSLPTEKLPSDLGLAPFCSRIMQQQYFNSRYADKRVNVTAIALIYFHFSVLFGTEGTNTLFPNSPLNTFEWSNRDGGGLHSDSHCCIVCLSHDHVHCAAGIVFDEGPCGMDLTLGLGLRLLSLNTFLRNPPNSPDACVRGSQNTRSTMCYVHVGWRWINGFGE